MSLPGNGIFLDSPPKKAYGGYGQVYKIYIADIFLPMIYLLPDII